MIIETNRNTMKVKDTSKFQAFDYISDLEAPREYDLGDVVTRTIYGETEIGVVIQIHDRFDVRTDMFGNACSDDLDLSTLEDIKKYRPILIKDLDKS